MQERQCHLREELLELLHANLVSFKCLVDLRLVARPVIELSRRISIVVQGIAADKGNMTGTYSIPLEASLDLDLSERQ